MSVYLFVCLFVSSISHKLLVAFWWKLVSREVMIIGRPSSKLGVIRIEIRIRDPDNCFWWNTGRLLMKFGELSWDYNSNLIIVITWVQPYSSVGKRIVLKPPRGWRVQTSVSPEFFVCLIVCLLVSRTSHKLLVGIWWNLVSTEVMTIERPSWKLGVILIEIRIWDPDNCFSWTTGRILMKFGE